MLNNKNCNFIEKCERKQKGIVLKMFKKLFVK